MLRADVVVSERARFLLCQDDHPPGWLREPLEHVKRLAVRRGGGLCSPPHTHAPNRRISGKSSWRAKRAGLYAALISTILNLSVPRGAATSTVSPFLWPMMALPTGDSFESLFSAGFASAEPTMWYSIVSFAATSRSFTFEPTET